jgi:hypothetical protein
LDHGGPLPIFVMAMLKTSRRAMIAAMCTDLT